MKRARGKSHCAVNFALETIGDSWSLLIVRDIVFDGKHTFTEFLTSTEKISSNILTDRLAQLEQDGILSKSLTASDRRVVYYTLTQKGIDLLPVLLALAAWGFRHDPLTNASPEFVTAYFHNPTAVTAAVQAVVASGEAVFSSNGMVHPSVIK